MSGIILESFKIVLLCFSAFFSLCCCHSLYHFFCIFRRSHVVLFQCVSVCMCVSDVCWWFGKQASHKYVRWTIVKFSVPDISLYCEFFHRVHFLLSLVWWLLSGSQALELFTGGHHNGSITDSISTLTENALISAVISGHYFVVCFWIFSPWWSLPLYT